MFMTAFEVAAPEMFTEFTAVPTELGAFDALTSAAAPAAGEAFMGATNAGILNALGAGGAQSLAAPVTEGIAAGGAGAGSAGINAAQVAAEQNAATQAANSGIQQIAESNPVETAVEDELGGGGEEEVAKETAQKTTEEAAQNVPKDRFPPPDQQTVPEYLREGADATSAPPQPNINPGGPSEMMNKGIENIPEALPTGGLPSPPPPSPLENGFNKAMDWVKKNQLPLTLGLAAYQLSNKKLNEAVPTEYNGPLSKYKMSSDFQGRFANPANYQYQQRMYNYAEGGIAQVAGGGPIEAMSDANSIGANTGYPMADVNKGAYATPWQTPISRNVVNGGSDTGVNPITGEMTNFASGGIASYKDGGQALTDYYERMTKPQSTSSGATEPHAGHGDPGIYYDLDPDTRYQDALTAAMIRQAKVAKRANMQMPSMSRPTPMGQLNLAPANTSATPNAPDMSGYAHGGIMQASLGGYAAGGNPRLLKGPGDGMSDNIPATISGKQPARLADGEFVVPADVVSHLGNGSTDAGAKKLHDMMTEVRRARTGNPKQGKQINPNKFIPT